MCLETLLRTDSTSRRRRSSDTTIRAPHLFSLFKANDTYYSTAPVVRTDVISMTEDSHPTKFSIAWHDQEDDCVVFSLQGEPLHGQANISDDGSLDFVPETDFSGEINLIVKVVEVSCPGKPALTRSLSTLHNITVNIEEENDEPDSTLILEDDEVVDSLHNDTVDIILEANRTTKHSMGTFFLTDVDFNDTLTIVTRTDDNQTVANFTITEVKVVSSDISATGRTKINTAKEVKVDYDLSPYFNGVVNYTLLGYDREDFISQPLTVRIYSLKYPCVHGECHQKSNISAPCSSKIRAITFDPFICYCRPGYEGQWCEIETDECQTLPCPLLYDCVDHVARYSCEINAGKLVAILFCVAMAIGMFVFLIRKLKQRQTSKVFHLDHVDDG